MSKTSENAEVVPVNKQKAAGRSSPVHMMTPFEEMEHWFEDTFPMNWMRRHRMEMPSFGNLSASFDQRMPKVDVVDRDDEVFIKAEMPGIDKKDIEVSMTDNTITIKGTTSKEEKEEKGEYYRCEISQGSYSRSLALPAEVNVDKSEATFKDGVLELRLPKLERAKRRNLKVV